VLIDGVDEVPRDQRLQILEWLRRLIAAFPKARFVVTSRPAAVAEDWLRRQDFRACFVQPMTLPDVDKFITHWHRAMAMAVVENSAKQELERLSRSLSDQVTAKRYLRQLATNPLLCALLCALNRDRRTDLPTNRIELFRISLEMFLQRRDSERQLPSTSARIEYDDKLQLLQELAYWMMTNGLTTADRDRVTELVNTRLAPRRHRVIGTTHEVLEYLLERSGVIREPVVGWVDFVHRSFQEYLAAQAAVDRDDIEALIERAADEQWRQVVIVAAGLGNKRQIEKIFSGLLNPPRKLREHRLTLELTALGCLETATEVDPGVAERIKQGAGSLIPPRSAEHVSVLSRVGEYAYDLLADVQIDDGVSLFHITQVAAALGEPLGLKLLEKVCEGLSPQLDNAAFTDILVRLWPGFDPVEFADRILARREILSYTVRAAQMVPGVARVPSISSLVCQLETGYADYTFMAKMPRLTRASISLPLSPAELTLAFPPRPCTVRLHSANASTTGSHHSGRTLVTSGLAALPTLRRLTLHGNVERVVIGEDSQITSLVGLRLPRSVVELEIAGCLSFSSLDGAEDLAGSSLERLKVVITRFGDSNGSFERAVAALFRAGHAHDRPLIEKLRYLHISSPGSAHDREVDVFLKRLTDLGFTVKAARPLVQVVIARR
jgi:NACHT domain